MCVSNNALRRMDPHKIIDLLLGLRCSFVFSELSLLISGRSGVCSCLLLMVPVVNWCVELISVHHQTVALHIMMGAVVAAWICGRRDVV